MRRPDDKPYIRFARANVPMKDRLRLGPRTRSTTIRQGLQGHHDMSGRSVEVVIVGGRPVGLTAAIALAGAGIETALVARPAGAPDNRTTALLASSVTALDTLGVWQHCRDDAAPLRVMRIIDDTGRLLRAPEVHFAASEIGLDAFGHNIENRYLLAALAARARSLTSLTFIADEAQAVAIEDTHVTVKLG